MQHHLEDLSRHKYGILLPKEWVSRDKDKDYGVDVEVEVFDVDGSPSGLVYWVQLKATSSTKAYTIKNFNLKIETLEYYRRLDIPVLIVRYSSVQDKFYYKWAHEIDLYGAKEGAKTVLIKFVDSDCWEKEKTPRLIQEQLKKIKMIRNGAINFPVKCNLVVNGSHVCGVESGLLLAKLRKEMRQEYSKHVRVLLAKEDAIVNIQISPEELSIDLGGVYHCVFHNVASMEQDSLAAELAKDIMLGLAAIIAQMGNNDFSAKVAFADGVGAKLVNKPDLLVHIFPQLLNSNEFEKAIEIAKLAIEKGVSEHIEGAVLIAILHSLDRTDDKKAAAIEAYLLHCVERNEKIHDEMYGHSLYNLGNFYRSISKNRKAIQCYLRARKHQPAYYQQAYFFSELGGLLFDIGKYNHAAAYYKKSLDIEEREGILPLYADSLMLAGNYQLSCKIFSKFLDESHDEHAEWRLKFFCLSMLLEKFDLKLQARERKAAIKMADISECKTQEDAEARINESLRLDLLCPLAWYNLGIKFHKEGMNADAAYAFIVCSLVNRNDLEAWVNATSCCFDAEVPLWVLVFTVKVAYFYGKDDYVDLAYSMCEQHGKNVAPFAKVIETIIGEIKEANSKLAIRFPNEDGKMINILDREAS